MSVIDCRELTRAIQEERVSGYTVELWNERAVRSPLDRAGLFVFAVVDGLALVGARP